MEKKHFLSSLNNAIRGIVNALRAERNLRVHFLAAFLVILASLFFNLGKEEFLILLLVIGIVMISELFNTSLEMTVDLITADYHPLAQLIKDIAAGAVLVAALLSVTVGYILFFKKLDFPHWQLPVIARIRSVPPYVTFIILLMVSLLVIMGKSFTGREKFVSGGFPSGHAAFSYAIATIAFFTTENLFLFLLILILASIVAESRVRLRIHSWTEVIAGALIGMLVPLFIFQIIE